MSFFLWLFCLFFQPHFPHNALIPQKWRLKDKWYHLLLCFHLTIRKIISSCWTAENLFTYQSFIQDMHEENSRSLSSLMVVSTKQLQCILHRHSSKINKKLSDKLKVIFFFIWFVSFWPVTIPSYCNAVYVQSNGAFLVLLHSPK